MDNQHYRYCFSCEKWKSKSEINEIDLGGDNKTFNCNVCRKDLSDQIQIFRCKKHDEEILEVWGVCDGENKKKVFFDKCPQEGGKEQKPPKQPPQSKESSTVNIILIIISVLLIIGIGIILFIRERRRKNK